MPVIRELLTKWEVEVDDAKVDESEKKVNKLKKTLDNVAKKSIDVGKKLTAFVTLPVLALGVAFIKAASDAEETSSKFAVVFQDVSDEAEKTAKNLSKNFGLSSTAAKTLLSDTGDLLSGFGFTGEKALELSTAVNELAVDLASFTNFAGGAEGASAALTKALLGERESVKSLGISILEEDVKKKVAEQRTQGLTFETERQAKAFATLAIAQQQSANAIGDFARTNQGFANQLRILRGRMNDLSVSFGVILLPIANQIVQRIIKFADAINDLSKETKTTIVIIASLAAVLGPLFLIFGSIVKVLAALKFLTALEVPLGIVIAKIAGIVLAFISMVLAIEDIIVGLKGGESQAKSFFDFIQKQINELNPLMKGVANDLAELFGIPFRAAAAAVRNVIELIKLAKGEMTGTEFISKFLTNVERIIPRFFTERGEGVAGAFGIPEFGPTRTQTNQVQNRNNINVNVNANTNASAQEIGISVRDNMFLILDQMTRNTNESLAAREF